MTDDAESKKWYSELKEPEYKCPNPELRECCLAIVLGDLTHLNGEVHRGGFHGRFNITINFCPFCGEELITYRKLVWEKLKASMEQQLDTFIE